MSRIALILCLLVSACALGTAERASLATAGSPYRVGVGDELRITIFGEENLSGVYKVGGRGVIVFPLLGEVDAAGSTIPDFREALVATLADGYLKDPNVLVELANARPVYILGEVQKPGEYPFSESMTVMQAVAKAGGFSYRANRSRVYILHFGAGEEVKYELDPAMRVAPGDTIRVGERYF